MKRQMRGVEEDLDNTSLFIKKILVSIHPILGKIYSWRHRLWNMILVGGTGYLIQLACQYVFLYYVRLPLALAVFFAVIIAFLFNYTLYEKWVFKG